MFKSRTLEEKPSNHELQLLRNMLYDTTLDEEEKELALQSIENCTGYSEYNRLQWKIESFIRSFDEIPNPNQTDIKNHLRRFIYEDTDRRNLYGQSDRAEDLVY